MVSSVYGNPDPHRPLAHGTAIVFLPLQSSGEGSGLDFYQFLVLPFTILGGWLDYVGIPSSICWYLGLLLTPPLAVAMLLFRGHLFASLYGVSRRQRRFVSPFK